MNKEQKAAAVEEIAERLGEADAIFAVDYRGISVPEAAELRARLRKAIATFGRQHAVLEYRGGLMDGEVLEPEKFQAIARLPGLDVLHGQLVGVTASPLTGLTRGLAAMLSGLAVGLGQIAEKGLVSGEEEQAAEEEEADEDGEQPAAEEEPAAEVEAEEEPATEVEAEEEPAEVAE